MDPSSMRARPSPASDEPPTRAEKVALNVFHDLQLTHARKERGAPERAARLRVSAKDNLVEISEESSSGLQGSRPETEPRREVSCG